MRLGLKRLLSQSPRVLASHAQPESVDGEKKETPLERRDAPGLAGRNIRRGDDADGGGASNAFLRSFMARVRHGGYGAGRFGGGPPEGKAPLRERAVRQRDDRDKLAQTGEAGSAPASAGRRPSGGAYDLSLSGSATSPTVTASAPRSGVPGDASVGRTGRPWHVVSVGGGPRASTQVAAEIDFMLKHKADFERVIALGGQYDIRTTVIEQQARDRLGQGKAWTEENEGTVNTGAEQGYVSRLSHLYHEHRESIEAALADKPVAAALFARAYSDSLDGKPLTHRGATTRALLGKEENEHLEAMVALAEADPLLKDIYHLELLTDTKATGVDLSRPDKPSVAIEDGAGKTSSVGADTVRLNTGTTTASPLREHQQGVAKHSYIGPMYAAGLRQTLDEKGLLDNTGKLVPGARVLTGGSGLSLYDQLLSLDAFMDLTVQDQSSPFGYRISEEAKENTKGPFW